MDKQEDFVPLVPGETPLEAKFTFQGIKQPTSIPFATIIVSIPPQDPALGYFQMTLEIPLRLKPETTVAAIGEWAEGMARRVVNTDPAILWLRHPESPTTLT